MTLERFGGPPDAESFDQTAARIDADRKAARALSEQAAAAGVIILWGSRSYTFNNCYAVALSDEGHQQLLAAKDVPRLSWGDMRRLDSYTEGYESRYEAVEAVYENYQAANMVELLPN
jgi:hypothetical protein